MKEPKCYKQLHLIIKKQINSINENPFAMLIIHCTLNKIRKEYGKHKAGRTIEQLQLKHFGFNCKH